MSDKIILVPVDFSATAMNALTYAFEFAERSRQDVLLFHGSTDDEMGDKEKMAALVADLRLNTRSIAVKTMVSDRFFNSLTLKELMGARNIGMVIMGTDGVSGSFSRRLFGTNASEVAIAMDCPVMIIPSAVTFSKMNKIAYASDLNHLENELPFVIGLGRTFNAQILVFHVAPVFPDLGNTEIRNIRKEISLLAATQEFSDIDYYVEETNWDNQTHQGIKHFIDKHQTDLLVLFHEPVKGLEGIFSSTETERAVKDLHVPVMVFPREDSER